MVFVGNNPILLFVGSVPNSVVALTEIVDKNGNDVIVIVHINKRYKRNVINKIASVYSKSDEHGNNKIINYVKQQIDAGNLVDASIKKAPIWFTTRGLQLPKVVQTIIDANNTVPQKVQTVNNNDMQSSKKDTENKINYSVKIDTDGNKFVDVDPELFDARDGESHAKTIARIIKERFNNLISVNGQQIQINKTTNDEWRRSNGADALRRRNSQGYFDKLKTIPYADEILKIAKDWIGEEWHHPRRDDIVEFARGNVYYRVGNNGYVADVIVAIRENGSAVLYDLDDIRAKKITDIPLTMASENSQRSAGTPVNDNISQPETEVKDKYSRQIVNDTWEGIRDMMYENDVHQEVITEIEGYIKKLRRRNLSRETALTEGLIMADKIVCHISHIIKYKNDIFIDGRRQDAVKWSNEVLKEMDKHKQKDSYPFVLPGLNAEYGMLTPIYFFKNIATHYDGDSVIKEYAHDEDYCQYRYSCSFLKNYSRMFDVI